MKKKSFILLAIGLGLCACGVSSRFPLDDVYCWDGYEPTPSGRPHTTQTETVASQASEQTEQPTQPTVVYTNVQDTTITVRIKR